MGQTTRVHAQAAGAGGGAAHELAQAPSDPQGPAGLGDATQDGASEQAAQTPVAVGEMVTLLRDPDADKAELARAAASLVRMSVYEIEGADPALAGLLTQDTPLASRRSLLAAMVASAGLPGEPVAGAVLGMLDGLPEELEADWARVLGRFGLETVVVSLAKRVSDEQAAAGQRRLAVRALGEHRRRAAAVELLGLTDAGQDPQVRRWAFEALANLSHLDGLGSDREAWTQWLAAVRGLDESQWQRMLYANLLQSVRQREAVKRQVVDRLIQTQLALYRVTDAGQRPALLVQLLQDPLAAVRLLGLDLARQYAEDSNAFGPDLRAQLRGLLYDPEPGIREESATLLGLLLDAEAADAMAGRLDRGLEPESAVTQAYLRALTQMPRGKALAPAYKLLGDPALSGPAAGMLAAAHRAGQGDAKFWQRVRDRIKASLGAVQSPNPSTVTLLGLVIAIDDAGAWQRIERWLDAEDERVRAAAARAWAGSGHELLVLAKRSDDAVIRPIALKAIADRGGSAGTLMATAARRPAELDDIRQWEQAMTALAGRVPPEALLRAIAALTEDNGHTRPLREQMLTAALEREDRPDTPGRPELLLLIARAQTRPLDDTPAQAVLDYEAALSHADRLTQQQAAAARHGLVAAYLADRRVDEAFGLAAGILKPGGKLVAAAADHPLVAVIADSADRSIARNRGPVAADALKRLRELLGPSVSAGLDARLLSIEKKLKTPAPDAPARRPAPPDPPADAPAS